MASGGPFHGVALEDAIQKSPEEALTTLIGIWEKK